LFRFWIAWLVGVVMWATAQHGMVMFHYPRWSPDGRWLVMTSNIDGGDDEEVWVVSADGVSKRRLTTNDLADTAADWLPDGRTIVFERRAGNAAETLAMDADGKNVRAYAPDRARLKQLRLVNGERTVAERRSRDGQSIYVKDASGERRIGQKRWSEQPSLSPDGRFVILEQRQDPHEILSSEIALWDSNTNLVKVLARGTDPSWSPDGRTVLFKAPAEGTGELRITILDVISGARRTLAAGVHPQFSPDGTEIVYMTDDAHRTDVYVIRVDGSAKRCLTCAWTSSHAR
jgi:Tol biopolymer transport system component